MLDFLRQLFALPAAIKRLTEEIKKMTETSQESRALAGDIDVKVDKLITIVTDTKKQVTDLTARLDAAIAGGTDVDSTAVRDELKALDDKITTELASLDTTTPAPPAPVEGGAEPTS